MLEPHSSENMFLKRDLKAVKTTLAEYKRDYHELKIKYDHVREKNEKLTNLTKRLTSERGMLRSEVKALKFENFKSKLGLGVYLATLILTLINGLLWLL